MLMEGVFAMKESSGLSSKEEAVKGEPSNDIFCQKTPSKDLPFEDLFPDEALPEDLSFEFEDVFAKGSLAEDPSLEDGITTETIHQDLSSENGSTGADKPFMHTLHTPSEENLVSEKDSELPDIRRDIVKSLRSVMQWCDDMANTQNDIITNFKSQLPFIIVLGVIILLLWVLKFIYG